MSEAKARYYEFGRFRLDARKRVLFHNGEPVHLTLKVFQLLQVLVEHNGQVLEKNDLLEMVWPDTIVEEANLKNSISTLRKALGDERGAETYIQTLPKRGYRFVAPVLALPDEGETYLLEKRATAEILFEEIAIENPLGAPTESEAQVESPLSAAFPATFISGNEQSVAASPKPVPENALALEGGKTAPAGKPARIQKGALIGGVLLAITALSAGIYQWVSASRTRSLVAFDKMKMTKLINVGNAGAVLSPDGKYIAYVTDGTQNDGLWVRQASTDSAIKLLPHLTSWGFTFSRDSNYVYCTLTSRDHPDGALYQVPVLGGSARLILEKIGGAARFSPDGKRLAFKRLNQETGKPVLLTASVDGREERIILAEKPHYTIWDYDWSPDGKSFAIAVRSAPIDGQITSWVIEIPVEGGEERVLAPPQKEAIINLNWLPDGSGLIMLVVDQATRLQQLWHLSYPGAQATRITNDSNWYTGLSIPASGDAILAQRNTGTQNIWLADAADLQQTHKITAYGGNYHCLKWTPDGRILHAEAEDGRYDLWVMDQDGTNRQRLTRNQGQNEWPCMSPDSRYIVFSSNRSGSRQIWRMDSDGRNLRQLTDSANECHEPRVTADSRWVIYLTWVSPSGWMVKKVSIDGGESVALADRTEDMALSPDGKMLAYRPFDEEKKRKVIAVKPLDGAEPGRIFDFPDFPIYRIEQWAKDGLLCISADSTQIILLPVDGGRPKKLGDLKTGERIFSFALSPDGRQLALSRGLLTNEAVMITNFKTP